MRRFGDSFHSRHPTSAINCLERVREGTHRLFASASQYFKSATNPEPRNRGIDRHIGDPVDIGRITSRQASKKNRKKKKKQIDTPFSADLGSGAIFIRGAIKERGLTARKNMAWKHYFAVALLFALASVYLGLDDSLQRLEKVIGRVRIEPAKLTHWENSTALNNGDCTVDEIANACEDVKIHFASSTAFIACGDPVERTKWYPPACRHNAQARSEDSFRENVFKHDIKTGTTTELQIEGLEGDFVSHGIDIYQSPNDPSKVGTTPICRVSLDMLLRRGGNSGPYLRRTPCS